MPPLSEETANKLINTVLEVHADVKLVKARQEDFTHRLFGNGQKGDIAKLSDEVDSLNEWRAEQRGAQGQKRAFNAVLSSVVASLVAAVWEWLVHRR